MSRSENLVDELSPVARIDSIEWKSENEKTVLECRIQITNSSKNTAWYLDDLVGDGMWIDFETGVNGLKELPTQSGAPFYIDRDWPLHAFKCLKAGECVSTVKTFEFLSSDKWLMNDEFRVERGKRIPIRIVSRSELLFTRIQAGGKFVDMEALAETGDTSFMFEFETEWIETTFPQ